MVLIKGKNQRMTGEFLGMKTVRCIRLMIGLSLFFLSVIRTTAHGAEPIEVFVSIVPQKYFVERIGGESVKVSVMVQPGANPATYEPKPRQMVALSRAKVYFAIGVPFEAVWLNRISAASPGMDTSGRSSSIGVNAPSKIPAV